jgi:hypothetical protein
MLTKFTRTSSSKGCTSTKLTGGSSKGCKLTGT